MEVIRDDEGFIKIKLKDDEEFKKIYMSVRPRTREVWLWWLDENGEKNYIYDIEKVRAILEFIRELRV